MSNSMQSLVQSGTKVWLDSIDPKEVERNRAWGATGATSNPIIISDLLNTGRFDTEMVQLFRDGLDDDSVAWAMTDRLVSQAQKVFAPVHEVTRGNDGYVSFELDPLIEDVEQNMPVAERTRRYIELGKKWSAGHRNRMIKIPNTPGGLGALEELTALGLTLNITLTFSPSQYIAARDAVWRGAQKRHSLDTFKSVYSIFVSRVDVFTEKHLPKLSPQAQGQVGIVNAKRIWKMNQEFWAPKKLPLQQEIIFASTGTKKPTDIAWKYVEAFAGSDIETNPPATNDAVIKSGIEFKRHIDELPPSAILQEIDKNVNLDKMEEVLMDEGLKKFADPFKSLLKLIASKRAALHK